MSDGSKCIGSAMRAWAFLWLGWMTAPPLHAQLPTYGTVSGLVEVYATIKDQHGKYVTGLKQDQFEVRDNGELQQISSFETGDTGFSCAILLDATGSMRASLPAMKNAVLKLIDNLRANDSVAVYSFTTSLSPVQDFTKDKSAAKKAVMAIRAGGTTSWFDAVAQIAMELTRPKQRKEGKKGIVAFTDGGENSSFLNAGAGITRCRVAGIPIYTIAQGDALRRPELLAQIRSVSLGTNGWTYSVRKTKDIDQIFEKIALDLKNTYMLTYPSPADADGKWRTIQLAVKGWKKLRIRAKEGYYPK